VIGVAYVDEVVVAALALLVRAILNQAIDYADSP
jgi:hypothetical protein